MEGLEDRLALCEALLSLTVAIEELLGCACEFIGSLLHLMRYRRHARTEVSLTVCRKTT